MRYPDLPASTQDELTANSRLYEAVARLLSALAKFKPMVLLLDNLHWMDEASLDLLHYQRSLVVLHNEDQVRENN